MNRREFMRSAGGIFCALAAMNQVFGKTWDVTEEMIYHPEMLYEKWPKDQFIFDVQTHHIDIEGNWFHATEAGQRSLTFFRMLRRSRPCPQCIRTNCCDKLNAPNRSRPPAACEVL